MVDAQHGVFRKRGPKRTVWVEERGEPAVRVAVKRFHDAGPGGRILDRRRAASECRTLRRLRELGFPVPEVLGIEEHALGVDLVTRWIDGAAPLFDVLRARTPWPCAPERAARALGSLLARAREHGLVHPDLHSGNVLVDAHGNAWLVDVRGVRIGAPLTRAAYARMCSAATADVREFMPPRLRLRILVAAETRVRGRDRTQQLRSVARAWNEAARVIRRTVVERSRLRSTRESSVTTALQRAGESGYHVRNVAASAAWAALDDPASTAVEGDLHEVRRAWWTAVRLAEHALPGPSPVAIRTSPRARAVFASGAQATQLGTAMRSHERDARAAWSLGLLAGRLFDRALGIDGALESAIEFDATGTARVCAGTRIVPVDATDPLAALARWSPLAQRASRRERARFVFAFASVLELSNREREDFIRASRDSRPAPARPEKLRRRVRARVLDGATRVAAFVPHPLVRAALTGLSPLASFTHAERVTRRNLELALGAEKTLAERARIARGVRHHAARQVAEWLRLARPAEAASNLAARGQWLEELVELDPSVAVLERALACGRGALVVTAHIGNWELLAARLRRAGHAGSVVGYRRPNDSSSLWFETMRRAWGVETIPQDAHPRAILDTLARGHVVGVLADLEVRRLAGTFVPFFGHDALTMTAPAALARAARIPLLPARCVFDAARGRYRLSFEEPLSPDPALRGRARTLDHTRRLNLVFERWIRADPEQWAWHQPRWRTRPGDLVATPLASRAIPVRTFAPAGARAKSNAARTHMAGLSLQSADQGLSGD